MQSVNELWRTLRAMPGTEVEYRFDINGVTYGREAEVSHEVNHALYTEFGFGNASCAGLTLQLYADAIHKSAKIQRFCRLVNGEQASEWLPAGVYYTSHRSEEDGFWEIEAFDDMRKAEKVWEPDQTLEFPMPMDEAVAEICRVLGFTLDDRSEISHTYTLDYPQSEQTFRQTLKWIAAAHGGNWIFTPAGKLRLVPMLSATGETHYLVDESRKPIIFGSTCIWVGEVEERDRHYIGLDLFTTRNNGKRKPVSRITLLADDENAITAGDDTGLELVADCPYATQDMVDALLAKLAGYEYQAFSAEGANLDPAAELGDGISADGAFFVLASIREDGSGYPDIAAPGDAEREEEYPEGNYSDQAFNRKLAQTRSLISKTIDSIKLEVSNEDTSSTIKLMLGETEIDSAEITLKGVVTFEALAGAPGEGTTTKINGGWIDTDTLTVKTAVASKLVGDDIVISQDGKGEDFHFYVNSADLHLEGTYPIYIKSTEDAVHLEGRGASLEVGQNVYAEGDLRPKTGGSYALGNSKYIWTSVFAESGEVDTSDRNKKNSIEDLPDKYVAMFDALEPRRYKLNSGTSDRYHVGFISQEVEETMTAAGISSQEFGGFVKDVDEDGNEVYMLRYSEFIAILTAKVQAMQKEIDVLKARG